MTLISNGTVLWRALVAAEHLEAEGIEARVLSMPTVNPLDVDAVVAAAAETGGIVTAEEATTAGGLGGAVAETLAQRHQLIPLIDSVLPLDQAAEAHKKLEAGGIKRKIVLKIA